MAQHSFTFSHALCRTPSASVTDGLRAEDQGDPDASVFLKEHEAYVTALRATGATVEVLPADEAFPDSVFIEDAALCLKGQAIVLRPGAESRLGESAALRPDLERVMNGVIDLETTGFVDGGDILCSDDEVMIGLSARTNRQGAEDLRPIVESLGYTLRILETPADILHFKTESSLLDERTILATPKLAASGCFQDYRVIHTAEGEEAAANAIRFNDTVFLSSGHPRTAEILRKVGYNVQEMPTTQAALVDGGLSCMSLRFSL
ncbi:dimethylargininase [Shimia gijangensis]|uniref:Dimethylargininase n=1 Tax=Shimia gijangensis TaxID=1470563 RepID=A0A1M6EAB7_9RHOB|nr:arginine deiminase-related protein [Shimia gijangensis]SHI82228.1 dimethylargininase [Shimia gijangensis]